MAKHEVLKFLQKQVLIHAKDLAEHREITEPGARATLHFLRRGGLVRQVWELTDMGKARLKHFDVEGCASPECASCRTEKQEDVVEWLFGR